MERVRVSPETVTVLGYRCKPDDVRWTGLDFAKADLRTQSSLFLMLCGKDDAPPDLHLSVPWWHPDDGEHPDPPEMYWRVRPRMEPGKRWKGKKVKTVAFERWSGEWWIAFEYVRPANPRRSGLAAAPSGREG